MPVYGSHNPQNQVVLQRTAGVTLSGHRVVVPRTSDGLLIYADNTISSHHTKPMCLTTGAITAGSTGEVLSYGDVTEPSWSWTPGLQVFLGANGVLTQTTPTAGFLYQVGLAETSTSMFFSPDAPIVLA